ncbi:hypothetical protein U1Q18_000568, partial [Sarracenia purpurea var. burkii]
PFLVLGHLWSGSSHNPSLARYSEKELNNGHTEIGDGLVGARLFPDEARYKCSC